MNTIKPTIQRMVLVRTEDTNGRGITLPAIVTRVHNDQCVDVVAFSGSTDVASLMPGGTKPMTSVVYDERQQLNTWCWGEFQKGQAAKTDNVAGELAKRVEAIAAQLAALNAKQPAAQRLPVADPTPVATTDKQPEPQDLPAGHPDLLGIDGAGGEGLRG